MSDPDDPDNSSRRQEQQQRQRRLWLQVLAFAAVYLIWGSTYLGIRVAVRTLPPFLMAGCRFLVAGTILYAVLRAALRVPAPTIAEWKHAAVAGALMLGVGNGLVTWAEKSVPSNLTALLVAAVPLFVALMDWLRPGGRRPDAHVVAGIAIGFGGMALLVLPEGGAARSLRPAPAGVAAVLVSGFAWALGMLYARHGAPDRHPKRHPLMAPAQQMLAGGAILSLTAIVRGDAGPGVLATITGTGVVAFLYLTFIGSLVAFTAYGWLVVVSTPARLSTTAYVNPVVAVALGWLALGEALSPRALGGAALIVVAVMTMTMGKPVLAAAARALGPRPDGAASRSP